MIFPKYELILPIGERCHMYEALKKFCPPIKDIRLHVFDSLGGISLNIAYEAIAKKFENFMLKKNLVVVNNGNGHDYFVKDKINNIRCSHLFKATLPPQESLDKYYPVLQRLMNSTRQAIEKAESILFCHATNEFTYSVWQIKRYCKKIRKLFPNKQIDFVIFTYDKKQKEYKKIYDKNGICIIKIEKLDVDCKNEMVCWSNEPIFHSAVKEFFGIV